MSTYDPSTFNCVSPFSQTHLDAHVQSDHAEIAFSNSDNRIVNVWNISNPAFHRYFDKGPFAGTHLYVSEEDHKAGKSEWLINKIADQLDTIAERLVSGKVHIQVILEGYEQFLHRLKEKTGEQVVQISIIDEKPEGWKPSFNATAILVNTLAYSVLETKIVRSQKYTDEHNAQKELVIPFVRVEDNDTKEKSIMLGVHVWGCFSQYPQQGLGVLKNMIQDISQQYPTDKIYAAGDFNTTPDNVNKDVANKLDGDLLAPAYPTHVNSRTEACTYDQAIAIRSFANTMLSIDQMTPSSQGLVSSIIESLK